MKTAATHGTRPLTRAQRLRRRIAKRNLQRAHSALTTFVLAWADGSLDGYSTVEYEREHERIRLMHAYRNAARECLSLSQTALS
jgi:hypothetical protein